LVDYRIRKFFSYYRPYLGLFLSVMACAVVVAAVALLLPLCVRYITKNVLESGAPDAMPQIYAVGALMLLLTGIHTAGSYIVDYHGHALGARMESDLRSELFAHLQKLSFRFYDERKTGELMSRITNDLLSLAELYHHGPEDLVIYAVKFGGAFLILLNINLKLTLVVFLFLPFMAAYTVFFSGRLRAALKRNKEHIAGVNVQVEDSLAGIRVVKAFANDELEKAKFAAENDRFLESRKAGYKTEALFFNGMTAFTQLVTAAVVVAGGAGIANASLDLANLLVFLLYIGSLMEPIQKFTHISSQYQEGFAGFERFMEIVELEPDIQDSPQAVELEEVCGSIEFKRVGFRYNENRAYVLEDISLDVKCGEKIALVGTSGVGKTTLCSLISRFYEVSEGQILLGGIDIREIRLQSLRRSVGIVQQDVYLFSGSVIENIRYGKPGASREAVIAAAVKANAHDFIMDLPQGYDTEIGQRGVKLSGGQKQRLSIARVFLKDPPILILDEATSALDYESEKAVQEALEVLAKDRTTFIIAHRLSTIRGVDRIVVLGDHGIEEQGTHTGLLAAGCMYARLYQSQYGDPVTSGETDRFGKKQVI